MEITDYKNMNLDSDFDIFCTAQTVGRASVPVPMMKLNGHPPTGPVNTTYTSLLSFLVASSDL
jgi:hypothetical protein